jgi:hypothetical protein
MYVYYDVADPEMIPRQRKRPARQFIGLFGLESALHIAVDNPSCDKSDINNMPIASQPHEEGSKSTKRDSPWLNGLVRQTE